MSSHGSAGQPPDPYGRDAYGQPEDPWSGPPSDPWGGQPASTPPVQSPQSPQPPYPMQPPTPPPYPSHTAHAPYSGQPPYPPQPQHSGYWTGPQVQPAHAAPEPPDHTRKQTALIVTVVVLALLLGVGGFTAFLLSGDRNPTTQPSTGPSATPTRTAGGQTGGPIGGRTAGPSVVPSGNPPASDVRNVSAGQCVINEGTAENPVLRIVPCAAGTYEVLARIAGTADRNECNTVRGYEFFYFYDSQLDSLDFVLCLRQR